MGRDADEKIVPGERVGIFPLGISEGKLLQELSVSYKREQRAGCIVYHLPNISFFVDEETRKVDQICVFKGFEGKFLENYGIGNDLLDIESDANKWLLDWETDSYSLEKYPGIIFGLEDELEVNEVKYNRRSTIDWICIAPPSKYEEEA